MDPTDLRILETLQAEGRLSNIELAEKVSLSASPCLRRVRAQEEDGINAGYAALLNLEKLDDTSDPKGVWRIANLVSKDVWIEVIHDRRNKPMQGAQGIVKAGFSVHDVDEIVEHATRLGLTKPRVVDSKLHHLRIVQLTDPDGNILQFTSPLDEVHDDK